MRKNYTSVPIGMLVGYMIGGAATAIVSGFLECAVGAGVGMTLAVAGLALTYVSKDDPDPEPALYRYVVHREGVVRAPETVYAASVYIDERNLDTYVFEDHDGETLAIYTRVAKIITHKVVSEED